MLANEIKKTDEDGKLRENAEQSTAWTDGLSNRVGLPTRQSLLLQAMDKFRNKPNPALNQQAQGGQCWVSNP